MRQGDEPERDDALRDILDRWDVGERPAGSQDRLLARYRREFVPWWRRWRGPSWAPLRIALPVAVSLVLAAGAVILTRRSTSSASPTSGPAAAPTTVAAERVPARASLAGFQPLDEVTATVVTESP
jgi:hypothetical protein